MSWLLGARVIGRLEGHVVRVNVQSLRGYATQATTYEVSHAKKAGNATQAPDTFQILIAKSAEKYENKDVFVSHSENIKHTHKELKSITDGFAIGLINPGRLFVGERFAACVPDGENHLYAYLASGRDGVIFYPQPHNIPMSELLIKLKEAKAKGLLMPETIPNRDFITDLENAMPEYKSLIYGDLFKFPRVPNMRTIFHTGVNRWPGMAQWSSICLRNPVKNPALVPTLPDPSPSQLVLALPQKRTQGKEGEEVAFSAYTQEGLVKTGIALAEGLGLNGNDRVLMAVPYHLGVVYPVVLGVINKAATLVQPFYKFKAQYVIDSIVKDRATVLFVRGSDLPSLWEKPLNKLDTSALRTVVVVGGLDANLETKIKSTFPTAKEVVGLDLVNDISGQLVGLLRVGENAVPLPYTEAKVVDDKGTTVKVGASGKLLTKGPHVSSSYGGPATWVSKDGWLDTSLQGKMKADGSFTLL